MNKTRHPPIRPRVVAAPRSHLMQPEAWIADRPEHDPIDEHGASLEARNTLREIQVARAVFLVGIFVFFALLLAALLSGT